MSFRGFVEVSVYFCLVIVVMGCSWFMWIESRGRKFFEEYMGFVFRKEGVWVLS